MAAATSDVGNPSGAHARHGDGHGQRSGQRRFRTDDARARRDAPPPWRESARRVVILVNDYLDFDGRYSVGGRQRYVRDLALLVRELGREVVVVQKARAPFAHDCPSGVPVIGLRAHLRGRRDLLFWRKARGIARPGDVFLYASGDDVWPSPFLGDAKAVQHGIGWDGEQRRWFRALSDRRALGMVRGVRSVLCVDTNFINWLRCQGNEGYRLADKCEYVPNYADLGKVATSEVAATDTLAIIAARRNSDYRGLDLLIEALGLLQARGVPFRAHISTDSGHAALEARAAELGYGAALSTSEDTMDEVLARYRDFHVAVIPTRWSEGTSLACVEALAAGLAVVTTPVGGLGNLVVPAFNGAIVPPSAPRIAAALAAMDEPVARARLQANARTMRDALGLHTWRDSVATWLMS